MHSAVLIYESHTIRLNLATAVTLATLL